MKPNYLLAALALLAGFGGGVAFHRWGIEPRGGNQLIRAGSAGRYQLISGGSAGNVFRQDTQTGDTWLITSTGIETLVLPPDAQFSFDKAKDLYETLKGAKILETGANTTGIHPVETLRDWAIRMNRMTAKEGQASSGIYDAAALRSAK